MLFLVCDDTDFSKLKPSLACNIFDTMISPILIYYSDLWGVYVKPDFKAWDSSQIKKKHTNNLQTLLRSKQQGFKYCMKSWTWSITSK